MGVWTALAARCIGKRADPAAIRRWIVKRHIVRRPLRVDPRDVVVAAVQEEVFWPVSRPSYLAAVEGYLRRAVDGGAQLVCFPELSGMLVLGFLLPFFGAARRAAWVFRRAGPAPGEVGRALFREVVRLVTPFVRRVFETTFREFARAFGVYIMAGTVVIADGGRLVNRAYLFGPDGAIVGTQDKTHLAEMEMKLGLSPGERLQVFDTAVGKVGVAVCMDATYFETFKILKKMGAQIIIVPIADVEEYNYYLALRGVWPRVQERMVYGVEAALVGDLFGMPLTGRAGVFAPLSLTPDRTGVVAQAATWDGAAVVSAHLDLTRLASCTDPYFRDRNPALYRKYFPGIYESGRGGER